jgi:hypothetical protein
MFTLQLPCLLGQADANGRRVLVPGTTTQPAPTLKVRFGEPVPLNVGDAVSLFGELRGKFHQQEATVSAVETGADGAVTHVFSLVGQPVNVESRQAYRVSTAGAGIQVRVDRQRDGLLADVSPEGMAVIVRQPVKVGGRTRVMLALDELSLEADLRVQTERKLPDGRMRYGLLLPDTRSPARSALEKVTGRLQRAQLARLRRGAA